MRQIVLDTETTGLHPKKGHRIIEVGCIELIDRKLTKNHFHAYINPEREVDQGAFAVHGISNEFLADKPVFNDVINDFRDYIKDDELIIHNAPFDLGFLNHEFRLIDKKIKNIETARSVIDTLVMAKELHPGQKNNLDALCKRYGVDNSSRELHGALLDARILALVYLAMTGGQESLFGEASTKTQSNKQSTVTKLAERSQTLPIIVATADELQAHQEMLERIDKASEGNCVWLEE